jgi:cobalt transporter subunit CbtA
MFRRILTAALVAGLAAGLLATALQAVRVWPLILAAESYEDAAPTPALHHGSTGDAAHHAALAEPWAPQDGIERMAFTLLFNLLAGFGFALLLNSGLVLRRAAGGEANATTGLLWGLAGFASFALAPALGLPPELPGMAAAELLSRQVWWLATAAATAAGIALIALPRRWPPMIVGAILLIAPHIVGAPHPEAAEASRVPAELAAGFVAASLATAAAFWAALGAVSGWLQHRYR